MTHQKLFRGRKRFATTYVVGFVADKGRHAFESGRADLGLVDAGTILLKVAKESAWKREHADIESITLDKQF